MAVAGGEIMNNDGKKHVQKAAANLVPPVRSNAARQLHLRNRFAAKGALRQMRRNGLAAKYTTALIRDEFCHCTHTALSVPLT